MAGTRDYAKERISQDMMPVFPNDEIDCADCRYRKKGKIGFKNAYCEKYPDGKPNTILFQNTKCIFKERGAPS